MKPLAPPRDFLTQYPARSSLNVGVERLSLGDSGSPSTSVVKSVSGCSDACESIPQAGTTRLRCCVVAVAVFVLIQLLSADYRTRGGAVRCVVVGKVGVVR